MMGIKEFGYEKANESIMKEFRQLHGLSCWKPRDPSTLSTKEKRNALSTVVFMKQKRDGQIKTSSASMAHLKGTTSVRRMRRRQPSGPTTFSLPGPSPLMKVEM